ncbi:glycosyl hydrolase [Novipirellula herctigrandis]
MACSCFTPCEVHSQDAKRGLGAGDGSLANSVNSRWAYDWGYQNPNGYVGEYVPMFWSGGNLNTKINAIKGYGNVNYVLGFNEPERDKQANMTVANAIGQWATISNGFKNTGIKLVSPAVSDTVDGRAWLTDFMNQVDADPNLTVDEVAFHWYGTVNINNPTSAANSFLNRVDKYHNDYGRNVWVTEFAGIDWGNNYTDQQMQQWNATFMKTAIAGLESRDHVTRYGWWNHNNDSRLVTKNSYGLWRPTEAGDNYSSTITAGQTKDINGQNQGTDFFFLRGGGLINDGNALGNSAIGRVYAMRNNDGSDASSSIGGSGDFGLARWGSLTVEDGASLQKIGSNTVRLRDVDIFNDGEIRLMGGTSNQGSLWISGSGTNAVGSGSLRLDSGSNLRLGNAVDSTGFELPYDIDLRGGTVTIDGPGVKLTGESTVFRQSFFETNQDFMIAGNLVGNNGGIVKRGVATMTLQGMNSYVGYTTVNEGTLIVDGSVGGNNIIINSNGTLGGNGEIASKIDTNGGTVAPGSSTGTLTGGSADFAAGSRLSLELLSISDFDRLVLNGSLNVEAGTMLELILLDGFQPLVGDHFDVLDFTVFSGQFGTIEAPTLANGNWDFRRFQSDGIISVSAVPEPSALIAMLLCLAPIMIARRRRKLQKADSSALTTLTAPYRPFCS